MPVTSGFSGFPHFTQRLLLTTSTYSFYFIFFYAKREIIFRKRTHGVWKRWVQICFYFLLNYKKKVVILFWYFSSLKSTRKEKLLYDSLRRQQALPCLGDALQRWLRHPEPSFSSQKSTIKCKCNKHKHTLFKKITLQKVDSNGLCKNHNTMVPRAHGENAPHDSGKHEAGGSHTGAS